MVESVICAKSRCCYGIRGEIVGLNEYLVKDNYKTVTRWNEVFDDALGGR